MRPSLQNLLERIILMNRPVIHRTAPGTKSARQLMSRNAKTLDDGYRKPLTTAEEKKRRERELWNSKVEAEKKSKGKAFDLVQEDHSNDDLALPHTY